MSAKPRRTRPIPTLDQIDAAEAAALRGSGRRLALMLRSIPEGDLIEGISYARGDIIKAIAHATGRMEMRRKFAEDRREVRRAAKLEARSCAD